MLRRSRQSLQSSRAQSEKWPWMFWVASLLPSHRVRVLGLFLSSTANRLQSTNLDQYVQVKYIQEGRSKVEGPSLDVRVAERSCHSAHRITNSDVARVGMSESHGVGELGGRGGRVTQGNRSVDGIGPVGRVQVLPRPPHTVDLGVVEVKVWVTCFVVSRTSL